MFLLKGRELTTQKHTLLYRKRDPITKQEQQKRETCITFSLKKQISKSFCKPQSLNEKRPQERIELTSSPSDPIRLSLPISGITKTEICNMLASIGLTKVGTAYKVLISLNFYLKHAAVLGLDVGLQATTNAQAL
ncbi:hypothetical protein [Bartonella sp. ML70XJBT.G]|uniref:hypothetical protein n=1 Tax=Bartonella sp. ML70XJBT.G TaxID=3019093 RepID=UPI00235FF336|nr:hypothetical protein [Bartonella sp. ML70XJBT.G]